MRLTMRMEMQASTMLDTLDPSEDYFDVAQGLHWYCADYHGGQWSREYETLCKLDYNPSHSERGPEPGTLAREVYDALADKSLTIDQAYDFVQEGYGATR